FFASSTSMMVQSIASMTRRAPGDLPPAFGSGLVSFCAAVLAGGGVSPWPRAKDKATVVANNAASAKTEVTVLSLLRNMDFTTLSVRRRTLLEARTGPAAVAVFRVPRRTEGGRLAAAAA